MPDQYKLMRTVDKPLKTELLLSSLDFRALTENAPVLFVHESAGDRKKKKRFSRVFQRRVRAFHSPIGNHRKTLKNSRGDKYVFKR